MENKGRKITLHLLDGHPKGIVIGVIEGRLLEFIRAPSSRLKELQNEFQNSGLYILSDLENENITKIYIGECENIRNRLNDHNRKDENSAEEFFQEFFIIKSGSPRNPLNKGHIRYLENRLIKIAEDSTAIGYIDNKTSPDNPPPLSESDISVMEGFIEDIMTILPAMGLNLSNTSNLKKDIQSTKLSIIKSPVFTIKSPKLNASLQEINGSFFVLTGSEAEIESQPSMPESSNNFKEHLINQKFLEQRGDKLIFSQDVQFRSPSAAASVVLGISVSGNRYWLKKDDNKTIGQWISEQLGNS